MISFTSRVLSFSSHFGKVVSSLMLYAFVFPIGLELYSAGYLFLVRGLFKFYFLLAGFGQTGVYISLHSFNQSYLCDSICIFAGTPNLPTRLETRTKESNICASLWVANPREGEMKVKTVIGAVEVRGWNLRKLAASSTDLDYSLKDLSKSVSAGTRKMVNYA